MEHDVNDRENGFGREGGDRNSFFHFSKRRGKVLSIGFFLLIIALVSSVYIYFSRKGEHATVSVQEAKSNTENSQFIPSPTPMPFSEMTIPALRERVFDSTFTELEPYSSHPHYSSYITSYKSDGLTIYGLLTVPTGEAPQEGWPAIVFVHGYIPPSSYVTTEKYEDYIDYLARRGFVVFKTDLRGHGESEGDAGGAYFSEDYVVDVLHARSALQKANNVRQDAVGIWGHSMAGNVALRALAARPEIPAIVIWAGAVYTYEDMQEYGIDDNSYRPPSDDSPRRREREELFAIHGRFDASSEFWRQVAATNYLSDIQGAVQLHHATNDDVVSVSYSRNLARLLEGADVDYEIHEYSSGGHNISGSAFVEAMQNTVLFFEKHLQN